jgi:hypothetical protein
MTRWAPVSSRTPRRTPGRTSGGTPGRTPGGTIKVLAAVALAAAVLAGCGDGPPRAGAAAIVGGERIETSTVGQAVRDWQREFRTDQNANQLRALGRPPLLEPETRNALHLMVLVRIGDAAARAGGVQVSEGAVDAVVAAMNREGGAASITRAQGLPGRYSRDLARWVYVQSELLRRYGATADAASPQSVAANRQAVTLLRNEARRLDIKINPRYGTFDANRVTIGDLPDTLSRPESGIG